MDRYSGREFGQRVTAWNGAAVGIVLLGLLSAALAVSEQAGTIEFDRMSIALGGALVVFGGIVSGAVAGGASDNIADARGVVTRFLWLAAALFGSCAIAFSIGLTLVIAVAWLSSGTFPGNAWSVAVPWLLVRTWWGVTTVAALGYSASVASGQRTAGTTLIVALVVGEQLIALATPDLVRLAPITAGASIARGMASNTAIVASAVYLAGGLGLGVARVRAGPNARSRRAAIRAQAGALAHGHGRR